MRSRTGAPPHLHAFVARGDKRGMLLYPHRHRDGSYVVSLTKFERDYVRVNDPAEIIGWLEKGFRLRMSNKEGGISPPSLVEPGAIYRPVLLK